MLRQGDPGNISATPAQPEGGPGLGGEMPTCMQLINEEINGAPHLNEFEPLLKYSLRVNLTGEDAVPVYMKIS